MNALPVKDNLKKFTVTESCPVRHIISHFSGKWSLLVLCILAQNGPTRFVELRRAIPDISPKVLSDTLKNLEADSLISRKIYPEIPPRVEYSLTSAGSSLMPHINALIGWAIEHFDTIISTRNKTR